MIVGGGVGGVDLVLVRVAWIIIVIVVVLILVFGSRAVHVV